MKIFRKIFFMTILLAALSACTTSGNKNNQEINNTNTVLGVNGYLWQATLDVLSFMSVSSAKPESGIIITEWYTDPSIVSERVRITVNFLSRRLRSDGLKVTVVRQKNEGGIWVSLPVEATTSIQVQNAILDQARILRQKTVNQ